MPKPDPSEIRPDDLLKDPLLRDAPMVEGFKVLDPAVLYARVGAGGMGAVYRGRHYKLDLDVAVKCLKPSLAAEDPDFIKRFEREARLAASIGHQNVVRVMDVHEKNGLHYLVMEFVRGETAAERVKRKGRLPEAEALAILFGACAGLAEAHQRGIVHRDIKPENVMISLEGRVKLADLGLAKSTGGVDGRSVSMPASRIMGTPQYMPPEQWETTDVTPAADVWALGASFYLLCTGRAGISGAGTYHAVAKRIQEQDYPTLRAERPDLRPEVHAMFERCVRRDPKDRFADARVLLRELRKLVVEDEDALLDPETGSGIVRAGAVTPPPRETLLRIRAQVETQTGGRPAPSATEVAPELERNTVKSPQPTVVRASAAAAAPAAAPAPHARWLVVAALLLVGALLGGYAAGWFSGPAKDPGRNAPAGDPRSEARAALAAGRKALPIAEQLDVAIAELERALQLDPALAEARPLLAAALAEKGEKLADQQPDAAFAACQRAVELDPQVRAAQQRRDELGTLLAARLQSGLAWREPPADALLSSRRVVVRGAVSAPNLKTLRLATVRGATLPPAFPDDAAAVQVIAGKFATDAVFAQDGPFLLVLEAEDQNGVKAMSPPLPVVVDTEDPVVTLELPAAGATVGSEVVVRGRVQDASRCAVQVGDREVTVAPDGSFTCTLTLPGGRHELVVAARDAGDRQGAAKRSIVVDAALPSLSLAPVPKVTRESQVSIAGTITDLRGGALQVDGKVVTPAGDGTFAVAYALPADQEYTIAVEAVDALGNRASGKVAVRRDTTPPVVELTAPDGKAPVRAGEVQLRGTVTDASAVTSVTVNGAPAEVSGATWTTKVLAESAAEGSRLLRVLRLTLVATDEAGNASKPMQRLLSVAPAFGHRIDTGIGLAMVRIEPATFRMGTPGDAGDEQQHTVTIGKAWWIGETEVTQQQWRAVMQTEPWKGQLRTSTGDGVAATNVSWNDAVAFCDKLTAQERAAGRVPAGHRYALPSEAEWELACRGSATATTAFCHGDDEGGLLQYAVFGQPLKTGHASAVRSRQPNAFGLYDMHGNVWEWCADFANIEKGRVVTDTYRDGTDPLCLTGAQRVTRGGSWSDEAAYCRSAERSCGDPSFANSSLGFRPALVAR